MQFDCIRLLPFLILALIAAFGRCDPRDHEFNMTATLNCTVKGSSFVGRDEENPDYCWAFAYYMENNTEYPNESDPNKSHPKCCATANTTDDIPKDSAFKEFVNIQSDGIHILYGNYLQKAAKDNDHRGVLIPMLSFFKKEMDFDVKFSNKCVDYDIKDGYDTNEGKGATSLDNGNRVAGNMIHFSYTDTANTEKMARYLGERWEKNETAFKRSYMSECHLCDEYLYLPIPIKNDAHTFRHIIFFDNAELKYRVGQPEGNFSYYKEFFHYTEDMRKTMGNIWNVHRVDNLCPVELRQWQKKFGPNRWDAFYLPFRLLYPALSTFLNPPSSDGKVTMIKEKKDCDYELIFKSYGYKLLVPQKR